jgi:hypothetical protein
MEVIRVHDDNVDRRFLRKPETGRESNENEDKETNSPHG